MENAALFVMQESCVQAASAASVVVATHPTSAVMLV